MTGPRRRAKPAKLLITAARAELLTQALFDQRYEIRRTLRLLEANPHMNAEEKYEVEQTRAQLAMCVELSREVAEIERVLKE